MVKILVADSSRLIGSEVDLFLAREGYQPLESLNGNIADIRRCGGK